MKSIHAQVENCYIFLPTCANTKTLSSSVDVIFKSLLLPRKVTEEPVSFVTNYTHIIFVKKTIYLFPFESLKPFFIIYLLAYKFELFLSKIFKDIFTFILCVWIFCLHVCISVHSVYDVVLRKEARRGHWDWSYTKYATMWMLGIELNSPVRVTSARNH